MYVFFGGGRLSPLKVIADTISLQHVSLLQIRTFYFNVTAGVLSS